MTHDATLDDAGPILYRNSLVLALHAMACVAGFIAGSSLPMVAESKTGIWRKVHDTAGPAAIAFVAAATTFSLVDAGLRARRARRRPVVPPRPHAAPAALALTPHAIPELVALFLPLSAWLIASRRDNWHHLMAATFVTTAIAVPMLLAAAAVEPGSRRSSCSTSRPERGTGQPEAAPLDTLRSSAILSHFDCLFIAVNFLWGLANPWPR